MDKVDDAAQRKAVWRNRIVGYGNVPPDQLLANSKNWRMHGARQQAALRTAIGVVGFVDSVIVQQGTDLVVDGHLRVILAMRNEEATIPVQYVDLDDEEADLVLATFDPIAELAEHDDSMLAELLAGMKDEGQDVLRALSTDTYQSNSGNLVLDTGDEEEDAGDGTEYVLCPYCAHAFPFNKEEERKNQHG